VCDQKHPGGERGCICNRERARPRYAWCLLFVLIRQGGRGGHIGEHRTVEGPYKLDLLQVNIYRLLAIYIVYWNYWLLVNVLFIGIKTGKWNRRTLSGHVPSLGLWCSVLLLRQEQAKSGYTFWYWKGIEDDD